MLKGLVPTIQQRINQKKSGKGLNEKNYSIKENA